MKVLICTPCFGGLVHTGYLNSIIGVMTSREILTKHQVSIATISNDVGLCFRFGQISNGSKFARFSMKVFGGKAFFKMHFAKSLAIREKTDVIRCAVTDFNSILAERTAYSIIIEFAIREASIEL